MSARLSRPYIEAVPFTTEKLTEARHYQDPEARQQLRQYLTSAQKFDEALEFGFPSPERATGSPYSADSSSPVPRGPSSQGMDGDDGSLSSYGPPTPTADLDHSQSVVVAPSTTSESEFGLPLQNNTPEKHTVGDSNSNSRSSSSSGGDREMTLRMTLTRPELRLSENEVQSWQTAPSSGEERTLGDPLALERLAVCDDATGAHGAFAVRDCARDRGLRRVWASLRRR